MQMIWECYNGKTINEDKYYVEAKDGNNRNLNVHNLIKKKMPVFYKYLW